MFTVNPVLALKDNYIWLIIQSSTAQCLIVDPGEAKPVLATLTALSLQPVAILLTHHHADHTAGVTDLLKKYPVPVLGSVTEAIPTVTYPLLGKEHIQIGFAECQVIPIPGHTHGHMAYYTQGALFCGDTLFTGGCGRVFEGTMAEMYTSLQRLAALPLATKIYCGHEYTAANLDFAAQVEPENIALQQRIRQTQDLRAHALPTVPSTLAVEKATNPFLRCEEISVKQAAEKYGRRSLNKAEEVFTVLREWKNDYS
jgi:hydroxyacylglutathione hydrolase